MSVMERAERLAQAGRQLEAVAAVKLAAEQGESEALLIVAKWRLFGLHGNQELALAHELLGRSAEAGNAEAARLRAILVANGTGCTSDPDRAKALLEALRDKDALAAHQLDVLEKMTPLDSVSQRAVEVVREDPHIHIVRGLLLGPECAYITALAEPALQPSFVLDPRTGRSAPHPIRTSTGMNFGPTQEDLVIHAINRRIAAASGTDVFCGEPLHVLRYSPGQEYKPHVDALPGVANQRAWTVLIYLNEGYSGGETRFTELGLTVRGKRGDALVFCNILPDGRSDGRTRHAGLPVTSGVKWLASRWIRGAPFSPWGPG